MSVARRGDGAAAVAPLITATAMGATACAILSARGLEQVVLAHPVAFASFLLIVVLFQLFSVQVYGTGGEGVAAIATLAGGIALGTGPAVAIGISAALVQFFRSRGLVHRAVFDVSNFALSAAAGAGVYSLLGGMREARPYQLLAAFFAGLAYKAVNTGLLCLAMALSESLPVRQVWKERFHWARFHYLAVGPLAFASAVAYAELGLVGLLAFSMPPALLTLSVRQYLDRTRTAVEEVRAANEELRLANAQLALRNDDLHELFEFTGGLAARVHDGTALVAYAETFLGRMFGGAARIRAGTGSGGIALTVAGRQVGTLSLDERSRFDAERWSRLREAILPQLATAIESTELVERVRKTHIDTIATLSRSMEAKDYYTGGHTERVAKISVALARRLGYAGADLDAIQIGGLLHDIGKIGIPERVLHKPGPLDDEEWRVMREHPLISDRILSDLDLSPIVRQIVRSSHERIDGSGYPDALAGDDVPQPARIVSVADAFDALTTDRPYRPGRSTRTAIDELRRHVGTQFCPQVFEALEQLQRSEPAALAGGNERALAIVA